MTEFPKLKRAEEIDVIFLEAPHKAFDKKAIEEERESVRVLARKLADHLRFSKSDNVKQVRAELLRVAEPTEGGPKE